MSADSDNTQTGGFGLAKGAGLSTRRKLALVVVLILLGQLSLDFGSSPDKPTTTDATGSAPDYESLVNNFETSSFEAPEAVAAENQILIPTPPESAAPIQSASFHQVPSRPLQLPAAEPAAQPSVATNNPQIRLLGTIEPLE